MKDIKEELKKEIGLHLLRAIGVILYFLIVNLVYTKISTELFDFGIQILTMICLFISIIIFEVAYKKDDEKLALQGIEILVLSTLTLTMNHITTKYNFEFRNYALVISYICSIYFVLRAIICYTKGRKEYAESLSDIKEIVKNEPIKKEASKKETKNKNEENEVRKND